MAFPASRDNSGAFNSLYTSISEKVLPGLQDWVGRETTLFNLAKALGFYDASEALQHHVNVAGLDSNTAEVVAFSGYQAVPTSASRGARSASLPVANYASNATVAWTEEQDTSGPEQLVDLVQTRLYNAFKAIGERVDRDMFWGSASNSLNIAGLEQAVFAESHLNSGSVATMPRWKLRQGVNTYAGVARTAFTADGVGGTNFENLAMDFSATYNSSEMNGVNTFAMSSGAPNLAIKAFSHMVQSLFWGASGPGLIISSPRPYEDYQNVATGLINYFKDSGTPGAVDLGFTTTSFRGIPWMQSDRAYASGVAHDATAGDEMIYALAPETLFFKVSKTGDFMQTPWKEPIDGLSRTSQIVLRGQFGCNNPRRNGVIFSYGGA